MRMCKRKSFSLLFVIMFCFNFTLSCFAYPEKGDKDDNGKIPNGVYSISSMLSPGKFLEISRDGAKLKPPCSRDNLSNMFYFKFDCEDGCYYIMDIEDYKLMEVSKKNDVGHCVFTGSDRQKWAIDQTNDDCFTIKSKFNGLKLCVGDFEKGEEVPVTLSKEENSKKQLFMIKLNEKLDLEESEFCNDEIDNSKRLSLRESLEINDSIKIAGKKSVYPCINVEYVSIPITVNQVKPGLFDECDKLISVSCDPKHLKCFKRERLKEIVIPNGVKHITKGSIEYCKNLEYIFIPNSVAIIDPEAAEFLKSVEEVICGPKIASSLNFSTYMCPEEVKSLKKEDFDKWDNLELIEIPSSIIDIEPDTFKNCGKLKSVTCDPKWINRFDKSRLLNINVIDGTSVIPDNSCMNCTSLTEVTIPDTVRFIGKNAFKNCPNLKKIDIKSSTIDIDPTAFDECGDLSKIECNQKLKHFEYTLKIPNDAVKILKRDYKDYSNIEALEIPFGIDIEPDFLDQFKNLKCVKCDTSLLEHAIKENLRIVIVPQGVVGIDKSSFDGCTNLEYLELPSSIREVEPETFQNCEKLHSVKCYPEALKFFQRPNLTTVLIKEGAKFILKSDFEGVCNLRNLFIPKSIEKIDQDTFKHCKKLLNVNCDSKWDSIVKRRTLSIPKDAVSIEKDFYLGCRSLTSINIPSSVKHIDKEAFIDCKKLKTVTCDPKWLKLMNKNTIETVKVPDGITEVSKSDFNGCYNLKCLYFPRTVKTLKDDGDGCFENVVIIESDPELTKFFSVDSKKFWTQFKIPNGCKRIPENAFYGCERLKSIDIPDSIEFIHPSAFEGCNNLKCISCNLKVLKMFGETLKARVEKLVVRGNASQVLKEDFSGYLSISTLKLPLSVKKVEDGTFSKCEKIRNIKCDPSLLYCFDKKKIEKISIPEGTKNISKENFSGLLNLQSIKIPNSINEISQDVFEDCSKLSNIKCGPSLLKYFNTENKKQFQKIKILKSTEKIESSNFSGCLNLDTIELPEDVDFSYKDFINERNNKFNVKETTMDDLVKYDQSNQKYREHVEKILNDLSKGVNTSCGNKYSLGDISRVINDVCLKISKKYKRVPRTVQCLAIIRLVDEALNGSGAIGEIKTGEGKSFIIAVVAIVLARYGRNVDVVTSTLELARRDEEEQRKYYQLFDISSAVLYDRKRDADYMPLSNIRSICEKDSSNDYNTDIFNCNIVYSTNFNFEFVYLRSVYNKTSLRDRTYDVVIVDEVDNMFLDQAMCPSMICSPFPVAYSKDITKIAFIMRTYEVEEIMKVLKYYFPTCGDFSYDKVSMLKDAALYADRLLLNVDYIIEDNNIVIIDKATGYKKNRTHWQHYIHQMVQVKENLEVSLPGLTLCAINQKTFFNMYNKIIGVTGTIGDELEENILKKSYNVNLFKMLRHIPPRKLVYKKRRPDNINELFERIYLETLEQVSKGRPVLIILDSIDSVNKFCKLCDFSTQMIAGINPSADRIAIKNAGYSGVVTVATNAAGRGIDIKLSANALAAGGLHVIVPMHMKSLRLIDQAVGRSGRQGQPGSASVYFKDGEVFDSVSDFEEGYDNLTILQEKFGKYIREHWNWLYNGTEYKYFEDALYPFNVDAEGFLELSTKFLLSKYKLILPVKDEDDFCGLLIDMLLKSWGVIYNRIEENICEYRSFEKCELEYNKFLEQINSWLPECCSDVQQAFASIQLEASDRTGWSKNAALLGICITSSIVSVAFPEVAPAIEISKGILMSGGEEIYKRLKNNEKIKWEIVIAKAMGQVIRGSINSYVDSSGYLSGCIACEQFLENYLCSALEGDTSLEALSKAAIEGGSAGMKAGVSRWIKNEIGPQGTYKKFIPTRDKILTLEEAEKITGNKY